MSLNNEVIKYLSGVDFTDPSNADAMYDAFQEIQKMPFTELDSVLSKPIGSITSRDQIIDPYSLVKQSSYKNTNKGRAQYQADLQRAQLYAQRQEASYKEWYESPEQQVLRERASGRNPDLVETSGGSAADVQMPTESPLTGTESTGQIASRVIGDVTSVVGTLASVANLAVAFQDIPLKRQQVGNLELQNEFQDIMNTGALGLQVANDIGSLLGTAMNDHLASGSTDSFDFDSWFANDDNFSSLSSVYGSNPRYPMVLANQRKAMLAHQKNALSMQNDVASGQMNLGQILSDPRLSSSQKLTAIQLRPFTEANIKVAQSRVDLEMAVNDWNLQFTKGRDVNKAIEATNAQFDSQIAESGYTEDYFSGLNGKLVASFEQYLREVMTTTKTLEQTINQGYLDMYNNDPTGIGGFKAAYLYGSNGGRSWQEVVLSTSLDDVKTIIDSEVTRAKVSGDFAQLQVLLDAWSTALSSDKSILRHLNTSPFFKSADFAEILHSYIRELRSDLDL